VDLPLWLLFTRLHRNASLIQSITSYLAFVNYNVGDNALFVIDIVFIMYNQGMVIEKAAL